jgi:hypothetical protein
MISSLPRIKAHHSRIRVLVERESDDGCNQRVHCDEQTECAEDYRGEDGGGDIVKSRVERGRDTKALKRPQ